MNLVSFWAISPQIFLSIGIVLLLVLVSWRRSQQLIASVTQVILIVSAMLSANLFFEPPIAVTELLSVDQLSQFSFILICLSAIVVCKLSANYLARQVEVHDEYFMLILLVVLGAGILVVSDHYASLFLGFELLSISLIGLLGYFKQTRFSVEVGFKYLILSAVASSFMLMGIAFIYSQTGTMSFSSALPAEHYNTLLAVGMTLFVSGIAFKLSLAPFHLWTPDVYHGAPTPIALLLVTVSKVSMFTVLIKCWFAQGYFADAITSNIIIVLALLSMIIGNILALKQDIIKRVLAFSSIAHMGYLLITLLVVNDGQYSFAIQSVQIYLAAYVLSSLSIFLVLVVLEHQFKLAIDEPLTISHLTGLFWSHRSLGVLIIISVLSFAGIPLTYGYIGKFYVLSHAANNQQWLLIAGLIIGSGISLAYYLPIIFTLFKEKPAAISFKWTVKMSESLLISTFIILGISLGILPDILTSVFN